MIIQQMGGNLLFIFFLLVVVTIDCGSLLLAMEEICFSAALVATCSTAGRHQMQDHNA